MLTVITQNGLYNAFIGLVRTATGRRIITYRKGISHVGDAGVVVCRIAASQGAAYSAESTILADAPRDVRDPEIAEIDRAGGGKRIIVSCFVYNSETLPNAIRVVFSDDDGDTWQAAITCASTFTEGVQCSAKVVQLANGDLLLPTYGTNTTTTVVELLKSTDDGATWTTSRPFEAAVDGGLEEPNIVRMLNDDLLMLVRTANANTYESLSTDNGATWSALVYATTDYGRPHAIQLPDGRVGLIQRDGNNTRAVVNHRTAGVWGTRSFLNSYLQNRMTYASSFIDEDGNWEIAVAQEAVGTGSDIYGLTRQIVRGHKAVHVGGSVLMIGAKE